MMLGLRKIANCNFFVSTSNLHQNKFQLQTLPLRTNSRKILTTNQNERNINQLNDFKRSKIKTSTFRLSTKPEEITKLSNQSSSDHSNKDPQKQTKVPNTNDSTKKTITPKDELKQAMHEVFLLASRLPQIKKFEKQREKSFDFLEDLKKDVFDSNQTPSGSKMFLYQKATLGLNRELSDTIYSHKLESLAKAFIWGGAFHTTSLLLTKMLTNSAYFDLLTQRDWMSVSFALVLCSLITSSAKKYEVEVFSSQSPKFQFFFFFLLFFLKIPFCEKN